MWRAEIISEMFPKFATFTRRGRIAERKSSYSHELDTFLRLKILAGRAGSPILCPLIQYLAVTPKVFSVGEGKENTTLFEGSTRRVASLGNLQGRDDRQSTLQWITSAKQTLDGFTHWPTNHAVSRKSTEIYVIRVIAKCELSLINLCQWTTFLQTISF